MKRIQIAVVAGLATITSMLWAQDGPPPPDDQQPAQQQQAQEPDGQYETGRAVGRISLLNGDVSVRRGDTGDVVAAGLNAPLMANDSLLTGSSARAEVQLDWANAIRLAPSSEVHFTGMDVKSFQMQVAAGTVTFRILRPSQAQAEVDTPSVAVHPLGEGTYRISVREDGTSEITVRNGAADVYSPRGSQRLNAGQTMYARGSATDPEFQIANAIPADSWDRWNDDRDRYLLNSRSYQHVSPDVSGAEDLDQYGQWVNDPSYGSVWQPNVSPGWAPYQSGQWTWLDYYGWTWVSYDPWGWAPYHYGRWFWGNGGWCWYPGPAYGHYFWAPAYVGFFGWGGHVGFGFGFGGLGWVALGPFEHYHPWWGRGYNGGFRGGAFARNTTIYNNANIGSVYRNARVNGAVMGMNANQFGRGGQIQRLNGAQIRNAGLVRGSVPVAPGRSSLQVSNRTVHGNFPARSSSQTFASHMQAPRVNRVSFDQQQRATQRFTQSNFSEFNRAGGAGNSSTGAWQRANPTRSNAQPSRSFSGGASNGAGSNNAAHGWSRFGEPIHGSSGSASNSSSGGWQRSGGAVNIRPSIVQQRPNYGSSPSHSSPSRSYGSPSRSYESPSRSYGSPSRSYSPSPSYQAPSRSYSSPSYSAPRGSSGGGSRSYSGGGRSSGGGGGHSGGGGGHSGGGGGGHHR